MEGPTSKGKVQIQNEIQLVLRDLSTTDVVYKTRTMRVEKLRKEMLQKKSKNQMQIPKLERKKIKTAKKELLLLQKHPLGLATTQKQSTQMLHSCVSVFSSTPSSTPRA